MTGALQRRFAFVTMLTLLAGGCATTPRADVAPTVSVTAVAETVAVGTANADAADDPAIWSPPAGQTVMLGGQAIPGFIAATDKKAGLYVYGFDGRQLQFLPEGLLNNVDLREAVIDGRPQILIGASDRGRMGVALYLFDPAATDPANTLRPWGLVHSDVVEPYGFCMGMADGVPHAVLIGKDGQVRQYRITAGAGGAPAGQEVRRFSIGSQSEGCVVDEPNDALYVGEELVGVWRYGFAPASGAARTAIQAVDATGRLVADVEGVTLIRDGAATYLLVSSQGDSAFSVWRVDGAPSYVGRFRVAAANGIDAVTGTDGLDARSGAVGPFPEGLVAIQDDQNEGAQNFKLVDWRAIRAALGLQ